MKIMIMGDAKKCAGLMSGGLSEKIDGIMNEGHEIIIGDGLWENNDVIQRYLTASNYKNVAVYISGGKRSKKINAGQWKEKYYAVNGKTMSSKKLERVFGMADDADSGLVIMGDDDFNADLINWVAVLALISLGKNCVLYPSGEVNPVELTCINDLEPYAGEQKALSEDVINHILSECSFSDEFRMFLVSKKISYKDIVEIIAPAPISLDAKLRLFRGINVRENAIYDLFNTVKKDIESGERHKTIRKDLRNTIEFKTEYLYNFWNEYHFIFEAKEALTNGNAFGDIDTVFYLFDCWYDTDVFIEKKYPIGVFTSIEQIDSFIDSKKEYSDNESYYIIELWRINSFGRMTHRFDYYTFNGEICWLGKIETGIEDEDGNEGYYPSCLNFLCGPPDLNIETPYKTGDIVNIDCRPFGPPFKALVLEAYDQYDGCFPNIVFNVPYTKDWSITPIKYGRFYKDAEASFYFSILSPLFRLRRINDDELGNDDVDLIKLKELLSGDEEKAKRIWEQVHDDVSLEELIEVFEE